MVFPHIIQIALSIGSRLTVDSNGNAFVESVAIGANESWDLSKLVDLQVLGGDTLSWVLGDDLEIDIVGLCDSLDGN